MDEPMRARYYHNRMTQKIPISNLSKTQTIPWKKYYAKNYAQFFAYSHKKEVIHKIKNCSTGRNSALFRQIVLLDINKCTEKNRANIRLTRKTEPDDCKPDLGVDDKSKFYFFRIISSRLHFHQDINTYW